MQVSTSTAWPRDRGSGRRTTRRKVTSVSPLGRDLSSAGAETRPRGTTSFRSITATLMTAASPGDGAPGAGWPPLWTGTPGVDGGPATCRRSVLRLVLPRWPDLAQELGDLPLDVLVEVEVRPDLVLRVSIDGAVAVVRVLDVGLVGVRGVRCHRSLGRGLVLGGIRAEVLGRDRQLLPA